MGRDVSWIQVEDKDATGRILIEGITQYTRISMSTSTAQHVEISIFDAFVSLILICQ